MSPKPNLRLRYMTVADLPAVVDIDQLSFEIPWSAKSYHYELAESNQSYMVVLEWSRAREVTRWQRWLHIQPYTEQRIVGYGGMWFIAGEAHISTIAVHPKGRGYGWGEILLASMIQRGALLQADQVALEVRVSNQRAQNLYRKYAFQTVDVKKRYYRNNNEDAYDMRLDIRDANNYADFKGRYDGLFLQHQLVDEFSPYLPPHFNATL